jgi:hypothetical protein
MNARSYRRGHLDGSASASTIVDDADAQRLQGVVELAGDPPHFPSNCDGAAGS